MKNTGTVSCENNEHNISVCAVDGKKDVMNGYFLGVCLSCGSTFEVTYRKLEEAFEHGGE